MTGLPAPPPLPANRLGMQPWALSLPDKELCLRDTSLRGAPRLPARLSSPPSPPGAGSAWRTPGTGEPGGLLSMGSHRVGHD